VHGRVKISWDLVDDGIFSRLPGYENDQDSGNGVTRTLFISCPCKIVNGRRGQDQLIFEFLVEDILRSMCTLAVRKFPANCSCNYVVTILYH
jgi:hypothetical protein